MRSIIFGSFLVLCCFILQYSSADSKNYKKFNYNEDNAEQKTYKKKYKTDNDDSEEDYKINKFSNVKSKLEDLGPTDERKYSKYSKKGNKHVESEEEEAAHIDKFNKKINNLNRDSVPEKQYKGKKPFDQLNIDEDTSIKKRQTVIKTNKQSGQNKPNTSSEEKIKSKKYNKWTKDHNSDEDDIDEDVASDESDEESMEEPPKKQFRRKIRVRIPDSTEDDSNEPNDGDYGTCQKTTKGGKRKCRTEESDNGNGGKEPVRTKKIKYSIKFAHEKQKISPSEDDNIMKKIHRGEKKKYKYQEDDDDNSSEEHAHPKRVRFLDEDEE